MMATEPMAKIEELRRGLLRQMWSPPQEAEAGAEESLMAEMACEDAATRMVSQSEWFASRVASHQREALAKIQEISEEAIGEARRQMEQICSWLGLEAGSSPDARAMAAKVLKAQGDAVLAEARDKIDAQVAINSAQDKIAMAQLQDGLDAIDGQLRHFMEAGRVEEVALRAAAEIQDTLARVGRLFR